MNPKLALSRARGIAHPQPEWSTAFPRVAVLGIESAPLSGAA